MGHASQIAAAIAKSKSNLRIVCIDGDGAVLMHAGGLSNSADVNNLIHIVLNNGCHESVGGQPTKAQKIDLYKTAKSLGYKYADKATSVKEIVEKLEYIKTTKKSCFLEIKCGGDSRQNLSRPRESPRENKNNLMEKLLNE